MKISPFLAAIPSLLLGGTSAPSQETISEFHQGISWRHSEEIGRGSTASESTTSTASVSFGQKADLLK